MTDQQELRLLIRLARERGAVIQTAHAGDDDQSDITNVRVGSGIPGVGRGWMPLIATAEKLREFTAYPPEASEMTAAEIALAITDMRRRLEAAVDELECLSESAQAVGLPNTSIDLDYVADAIREQLETLETRSQLPLS